MFTCSINIVFNTFISYHFACFTIIIFFLPWSFTIVSACVSNEKKFIVVLVKKIIFNKTFAQTCS